MKLSLLSALSASASAAVLAYKDFRIPAITSHQPNGNPDGQVNYYNIDFTVTSTNSGSQTTGYCHTFWGDNSWLNPEAYSLYVPTDQWFACDAVKNSYAGDSSLSFQLFEYFSIGNFSVEVRETLDSKTSLYGFGHISNATGSWDYVSCTINDQQVDKESHASGDCSLPSGAGPIHLQVYNSEQSGWY